MSRTVALLAVCVAACGADDAGPGNGGADAGAGEPSSLCADDAGIPMLTWDTFGEAFLLSRCWQCHAESSPDRNNAPATIAFGSMADVRSHRDRIEARVIGKTMPPNGGLFPNEVLDLEDWLACDPCTKEDGADCP